MSYIESSLLDGEKVVYRATLHWVVLLAPVLFVVISLFVMALWVYLGLFFLILSLIWALSRFLGRRFTEFAITDRRILIKTGILNRRSLEVILSKVESIAVEQSIWGRMLNFGTIVVKGTGGTRQPFSTIATPFEFRKAVQDQVATIEKQ